MVFGHGLFLQNLCSARWWVSFFKLGLSDTIVSFIPYWLVEGCFGVFISVEGFCFQTFIFYTVKKSELIVRNRLTLLIIRPEVSRISVVITTNSEAFSLPVSVACTTDTPTILVVDIRFYLFLGSAHYLMVWSLSRFICSTP